MISWSVSQICLDQMNSKNRNRFTFKWDWLNEFHLQFHNSLKIIRFWIYLMMLFLTSINYLYKRNFKDTTKLRWLYSFTCHCLQYLLCLSEYNCRSNIKYECRRIFKLPTIYRNQISENFDSLILTYLKSNSWIFSTRVSIKLYN